MATKAEERKIVTIENAIITNVNTAEAYGGSNRRLDIFVNRDDIESYDKTGKEITTNHFSVDFTKIADSISEPLFKLINIKAMGRVIAPEVFALCLTNAEITVDRIYYKKGETRNDRAFERDTIVTEVKNVTLHMEDLFKAELQRMLQSGEVYLKKATAQNVAVNFYNV